MKSVVYNYLLPFQEGFTINLKDAILCYEKNRKVRLECLISRYDEVLDKKTKGMLEMLRC